MEQQRWVPDTMYVQPTNAGRRSLEKLSREFSWLVGPNGPWFMVNQRATTALVKRTPYVFRTGDPATSSPLISALRIYSVLAARHTDAPLTQLYLTETGRQVTAGLSVLRPPVPGSPSALPRLVD